jgi:hypothetical protein
VKGLVDQALKDFIKQSLAKGISKEDLKKVLIKKGWDAKDVNLAMNSSVPVTTAGAMKKPETVSTKKPFNKKWLLIGIGALVVLFLFGIVGFWVSSMLGSIDGIEGGESDCYSDDDCGSDYECSRGECVYVGDDDVDDVDEDECSLDSDCSTGYECSFGTCVVSSTDDGGDDDVDEEVNCTGICRTGCPEYCGGTEVLSGVTVYADIDPDNITEGSCGDWTECEYNLPFSNTGNATFSNAWNINCSLYAENGSLVDYDKISVHDTMEAGERYSVTAEFDVEEFMPNVLLENVTVICTLDMYSNITESNEGNNVQTNSFIINRTVIPTYDCDYSFIEGASLTFDSDTLVIVNITSTEVNVTVDGVAGSVFAKTEVSGLNVAVSAVFGDYVNMTVYNQTVCPHYELACLNDKLCACGEMCSLGVCVAGSVKPECSDNCDNDADLYTDWPDDPECANSADPTENVEETRCNDGLDNDFDLLEDWPADPGCLGPWDDDERNACTDRVDNDGDGLVDYAGLNPDPGCVSGSDDDEWNECNGADDCGLGWVCDEMVCVQGECNDGVDNDGDNEGARIDVNGKLIGDGGIDYAGACEFEGLGSTLLYSCEELGFGIAGFVNGDGSVDILNLRNACEIGCVDQGGEYILDDEDCAGFDDWDEDASLIHADVGNAKVSNQFGSVFCNVDNECDKGWVCNDHVCERPECNDGEDNNVNDVNWNDDYLIDFYGGCWVYDSNANRESYACDELGVDYEDKQISEIRDECKEVCINLEYYEYSPIYRSFDPDCEQARDDNEGADPIEVDWGNVEVKTQPGLRSSAEYEDLNWYQKVWNWLFVSESVDVLNY